ncbi:heme biosynthesis HemY N-terminal domain-containing protein [Thermomonas sp.]|uniref:heme biosynthesis HemY N-terminal domain-containing protein n=1 Tax=Thermomonas sp. TaxID=1971895 RepID=UPI0035B4F15C
MGLFRNVMILLLLAVLGAVLAQVLLQDPGYVLVRYRGYDYSATLVTAVGLLLAVLCVAGMAWALLRWPFRTWQRRRKRRARASLLDGLLALERGDTQRAEQRLREACMDVDAEPLARLQAARAAFARDDDAAGQTLLAGFGDRHAALRALLQAERALALGQPEAAQQALEAPAAQPLPPRGQQLLAQARAARTGSTGADAPPPGTGVPGAP